MLYLAEGLRRLEIEITPSEKMFCAIEHLKGDKIALLQFGELFSYSLTHSLSPSVMNSMVPSSSVR